MNPRQRMLAIKLAEKLAKNPEYAKAIGVEMLNKKDCKENSNKYFAERSINYG